MRRGADWTCFRLTLPLLAGLALTCGCGEPDHSPGLPPRLAARAGLPAHRRDTTLIPAYATGLSATWGSVRLEERQIGLDLSNARLDRVPALCRGISEGVSVLETGVGTRARKPLGLPAHAARLRVLAAGLADLARSDQPELAQARYEDLREELGHFAHAIGDSALGRP